MKNDNELIKRYQNGSVGAFDELVRRHLDEVYRFFIKFTNDPMDAEDLAQDIFLKLYKSLKKFRFEAEFKTYLYRININAANNYLRRNRWRKWLHLDESPEQIDDCPGVESDWTKKELWDAVAKLPKAQRIVVTMRVAQNMPHKDIATIIGKSVSSVKTNYHYGISQLKKQLGNVR
ncbi:MAG: sigma-70 family RNA polymerase sigma factor [Planctomycetia bacterium]|nr:sigma-70 family RNA polymerase sigma factor [Planctomycetia bacterium]